MPAKIAVASFVVEEEALWVYGGPESDVRSKRDPVDLDPLIDQNLMEVVSPNTVKERTNFVNFAAALGDDGEAITAAIALERSWAIATDDRKALLFIERNMPHLQVFSTLQFVKHWVDVKTPSKNVVRQALRDIRDRAVYLPGKNHPLYSWWEDHI